ncbi:MAG: ABC transporter permease [Anaerolineales bacterium]|nr:ABC transporter permease [Anaerolineales bacterium]
MGVTNSTLETGTTYVSPRRRRVFGIIFLGIAALIWLFFMRGMDPESITTMRLYPGGSQVVIDDWEFNTLDSLQILAFLCGVIGSYQLVRGFGKRTGLVLTIIGGMFVFAFLSWAAANGMLNLAGMLRIMLIRAVPLVLGAMSGILCERAGVVNIAIEGMMLTAAMVGTIVGSLSTLWIGLLGAVLAGGLLGLMHAILSIRYRTDQIISGTVINIFAVGITSFISAKFMQPYPEINDPGIFKPIEIPFLGQIPILGPVLFKHNIFVYAMIFFVIFLTFMLFKTRWGLRHRSVGEHPRAADTLGINVYRTRYIAVILGGMMAGFAGAYFTLGSVGRFDQVMTAGRGFIALAAMIFGNWMPVGALGAGLLFGFSDSLAASLALLNVNIPSEFLLMTPYLLTMIVLAGVVGRGQMPAADGQPYEKD